MAEGESLAAPPAGDKVAPGSAVVAVVCYNNGAQARESLRRLPLASARDFSVVVVDDGSTDDTAALLAELGLPVVRHASNRGLGAAIKSGMRYALDQRYDFLVIMAGNGKDDPREVPRLLAPLRGGSADYVQGSRFAPGGSAVNTPAFRFVMVKLHAVLMRLLTGFPASDALNGFRAYRTALLREPGIDVWQDWLDGYELETYLHFQVLRSGRRVVEVGVSKVYPPRRNRARYSHIRPLIDWWRILRPLPLLLLRLRR